MSHLIYIHGFLSSPKSQKAQLTKTWLEKNRPDIHYHCPQLSSYPAEAKETLDKLTESLGADKVYVIGSSLGGFWATYLIEQRKADSAVLVNPAVSPHTRFTSYVGQEFKSYYGDETYTLGENDIEELAKANADDLQFPERYWLMVQTGDETLDYRLAVDKYKDCKQTVEEGGNHSFDGYDVWIPNIIRFLDC